MTESGRNFMVGAFVLVGLCVLAGLTVMIGRGPTWLTSGDSYPLRIKFRNASGVRAGNVVTVGGISVGRVSSVDFLVPGEFDAGVVVTVTVKKRYPIPVDSTAITTEPVLGQGRPAIEIVPGTGPVADMDPTAPPMIEGRVRGAVEAVFPPRMVNTIEKATAQVGDAAEAMTPALRELEDIIKRRNPEDVDRPGGLQGNLSSVFARLDATLKHTNEVIGDPDVQTQIKQIVANTEAFTEDAKAAVADVRAAADDTKRFVSEAREFLKRADTTLTNADTQFTLVARDTREVLQRGSTFMDHLNDAGAKISRGEGTIGRLVMDDKLYEALVLSTQRLAQAIEDFRQLIADWQKGKIRVAL